MRKPPESITPEVVIRLLAYGIVGGIAVIVIYAAQALFIQPVSTAALPVTPPQTAAPGTPATFPSGEPASPVEPVPDAGNPPTMKTDTVAAEPKPAHAIEAAPVVVSISAADEQRIRWAKSLAVLGTALLLAGSALLAGTFLGFLFGIPRALQQQGAPEGGAAEGAAALQGAGGRSGYGANTSLEQISDWLTKILVGVGLTQLSSLPSALMQFANFAHSGLGGFESSNVFAVALLIYFLICGFLMSYLWTRLRLGKAFSEADALAAIRGEIETAVSEVQKKAQGQVTVDYEALRLTEKQLESGDVPQEELNRAIRGTSDLYRTHIYQLATTARRENWRDPKRKPKMERSIPIFRALIDTDKEKEEERFHQNYGQLGFALAEASPPDYKAAKAALDKAIALRGPWDTGGYPMYELVRAICQIGSDPNLPDRKPAEPKTRNQVLEDLRVAAHWQGLRKVIEDDERISAWLKVNHASLKSLFAAHPDE